MLADPEKFTFPVALRLPVTLALVDTFTLGELSVLTTCTVPVSIVSALRSVMLTVAAVNVSVSLSKVSAALPLNTPSSLNCNCVFEPPGVPLPPPPDCDTQESTPLPSVERTYPAVPPVIVMLPTGPRLVKPVTDRLGGHIVTGKQIGRAHV